MVFVFFSPLLLCFTLPSSPGWTLLLLKGSLPYFLSVSWLTELSWDWLHEQGYLISSYNTKENDTLLGIMTGWNACGANLTQVCAGGHSCNELMSALLGHIQRTPSFFQNSSWTSGSYILSASNSVMIFGFWWWEVIRLSLVGLNMLLFSKTVAVGSALGPVSLPDTGSWKVL